MTWLLCSLTSAYTCPDISEFYVDCSNSTFAQSINLCSQYGMNSLNLTDSTITLLFKQTIQLLNCTNYFWYTYQNQIGLVGNLYSLNGSIACSIVPLLGVYCVSTPITQAATICTRNNQVELQQKCSDDQLNSYSNMQQYRFVRKTIYANILNRFQTRTYTQCNSICSKIDKCIGTNYQQSNCTLYM